MLSCQAHFNGHTTAPAKTQARPSFVQASPVAPPGLREGAKSGVRCTLDAPHALRYSARPIRQGPKSGNQHHFWGTLQP
jgi:hypothetical protein